MAFVKKFLEKYTIEDIINNLNNNKTYYKFKNEFIEDDKSIDIRDKNLISKLLKIRHNILRTYISEYSFIKTDKGIKADTRGKVIIPKFKPELNIKYKCLVLEFDRFKFAYNIEYLGKLKIIKRENNKVCDYVYKLYKLSDILIKEYYDKNNPSYEITLNNAHKVYEEMKREIKEIVIDILNERTTRIILRRKTLYGYGGEYPCPNCGKTLTFKGDIVKCQCGFKAESSLYKEYGTYEADEMFYETEEVQWHCSWMEEDRWRCGIAGTRSDLDLIDDEMISFYKKEIKERLDEKYDYNPTMKEKMKEFVELF